MQQNQGAAPISSEQLQTLDYCAFAQILLVYQFQDTLSSVGKCNEEICCPQKNYLENLVKKTHKILNPG